MAAALTALQHRERSFVVRGKPAKGIKRSDSPRRLRPRSGEPATLIPQPRFWLPLDMDSVPCPAGIDSIFEPDAVVEHVVELLSEEFHGISVFWCFTSGHGIKPGIRIRLWFWLDRPVSDADIKTWLAPLIVEKLIDPALYNPVQAIYTAAPEFAGTTDPVPYRCGIWRGHSDAVTPPPIIEKPSARCPFPQITSGDQAGGGGYEFHRNRIGDHEGGVGFFRPVKSATAAFIAEHGAAANTEWLRADLEQAIREAPRDPELHDDAYIEFRVADLDLVIGWVVDQEAAKKVEVEACEPTYPAPLGSIGEARRILAAAMDRFADVALAWQPPGEDDADAPPPVHALNAEIGTGKTRAWRERVAPRLLAAGKRPVLAVPRHKLGDEIVRDFAEAGITARVYRGREADDPEAPGEKMCRDLPRVKEIEAALGNASTHACKSKADECEFFNICGYQQQREQRPDIWIVPHQLPFRQRPAFIKCDALAIDESFHDAALHGTDNVVELDVDQLLGDRKNANDMQPTHELVAISRRAHAVLEEQPEGRLPRRALLDAGITTGDVGTAYTAEWRRKLALDVYPGILAKEYKAACAKVAMHNQMVARLARFWRLLKQTIEAPDERSSWMQVRYKIGENGKTSIVVTMAWRDEIHPSWRVPTMVMDATMPVEIVRQFFPQMEVFPQMEEPVSAPAPMPHTKVRQITDRPMAASMLIASPKANDRTNATRRNNVERVRRFIEVRAADVLPDRVLIVCQQGLEAELQAGALPENVAVAHYNDITGLNSWSDVALLIAIGRTEPSPQSVERNACALFGADVAEVQPDEKGEVRYPRVARGIRMRDGTGRKVEGNQHPDRRAEAVRWSICEVELIQAIGRGRGVNRTAADPLAIDILTNIVLPIEVDEATIWDAIQPTLAETMHARGTVLTSYRDMAAAYPDLFDSADAARMGLGRENPEQMPIEEYLIGVCSGFLSIAYRRTGSRGPAARLLFDPGRVEPAPWLAERIGEVTILGDAEPATDLRAEPEPTADVEPAAPEPARSVLPIWLSAEDIKPVESAPVASPRACEWFVDTTGDVFRRCGAPIHDGRDYCRAHRAQRAETLLGNPIRPPLPFGPFPTGAPMPLMAAE